MNTIKSGVSELFFQKSPVCFECTQCGHCCTGKDAYVFVSLKEAEKIRSFLGVTKTWFNRRYLVRHSDGDLVLSMRENGDCTFLDKDAGCRIYTVRPVQCSTYPFWPEIIKSKKAWFREKVRCEGINRGQPVSLHKIQNALELLSDDE